MWYSWVHSRWLRLCAIQIDVYSTLLYYTLLYSARFRCVVELRFWMARTTPNIAPPPSRWGIYTPSNTWFHRQTRAFIKNGISISSAVSAQLFTMGRYVSPKIAFSSWGIGSPSNTRYLIPPQSSSQTASRSIRPFLCGSPNSQKLCCTMHCHWERKLPKLTFPLGTSSPRQRRIKSRR